MKLAYACWNNTIKFQIHFHGIGCPWTFLFLCAYSKVILASSFISLQTRLTLHPAAIFFLTLPLQFLQDPGLAIPLPHKQPSVFSSPHSLLSHPVLHFPALWTGHSAVTEWETLLWVPLVNVSITSSLRQRGKSIKEMENAFLFHFILFYFKKFEGRVVLVLLNFS